MKNFTTEEKMQFLKDIIAMKTVNDNEVEVANYIAKMLEEHGIEHKVIPVSGNRANLFAEIGSGHPVVAVTGHMDVVDPGDLDSWSTDPFELTEKDGKLYGRGTADMKAGLAASVIALIEIKENNLLQKGTIRLLATTGEEVGEDGARTFHEQGYMKDADMLIINEPSQDDVVYAHKGSMDIEIESKGIATHSSMPEHGYNAIDPLMEYLVEVTKVFREDSRSNEVLGKLIMNTTVFHSGAQVNSIPDKAVAKINVRTIPEFDNDEVLDILHKYADKYNKEGAKLSIDVEMSLSSVFGDKDSKLVKEAQKLGEKYFGKKPEIVGVSGVTDASYLLLDRSKGFDLVMYGPGHLFMAHQTNEYVSKDTYLKFTDLLKELMLNSANEQ